MDTQTKKKRKPTGAAAMGAGPGRPKGSKNKTPALIREMVATALDRVGGVEYLARQAEEKPVAFMALVGKVLPVQVTGADGSAIQHSISVSFVYPTNER